MVRQKGQKPEQPDGGKEVQKRVGHQNLASKERHQKILNAQQQRQRVPPIVMKAAKQIWMRSANRPEGQLTQRQALMAAMRLFRQRQAQIAA